MCQKAAGLFFLRHGVVALKCHRGWAFVRIYEETVCPTLWSWGGSDLYSFVARLQCL